MKTVNQGVIPAVVVIPAVTLEAILGEEGTATPVDILAVIHTAEDIPVGILAAILAVTRAGAKARSCASLSMISRRSPSL